jgi:hypothetical protein
MKPIHVATLKFTGRNDHIVLRHREISGPQVWAVELYIKLDNITDTQMVKVNERLDLVQLLDYMVNKAAEFVQEKNIEHNTDSYDAAGFKIYYVPRKKK